MCGSDSSIRIEKADNGFTIDHYSPGTKDGPGVHKRSVAITPDHVLKTVAGHLGKMGTKPSKGMKVLGGNSAVTADATSVKKVSGKKKVAYKR